jgi:uncharacterized protein (TIGR02145 family)
LYRDNSAVGAVLDGAGSAATFSGSFNVAGAYTAWTVADDLYCASAMNETHVVVENPLPDNPAVNNISRNCPGTVTLSASSSGALISWYADAAVTSTLFTGASYPTPEIETSTTYYVQAKLENTGCLSARVPVSAEVITEGCCHEPGVTGVTFAAFNPCAGAPYGSTYTLTDDRDNKQYKIKYLPDGQYWMVQSLKFGDQCEKISTFSGSSSDQLGQIHSSGTYYGKCRNAVNANTGYVYDWAAAVNAEGAYYNSTVYKGCSGTSTAANICQGICPAGWHLPTYQEATLLKSAYETYYCSSCWGTTSAWEPQGYSQYNGTGGVGACPSGDARQWTSYYNNASKSTIFGSALCYNNTLSINEVDKNYGFNVRCLLNN